MRKVDRIVTISRPTIKGKDMLSRFESTLLSWTTRRVVRTSLVSRSCISWSLNTLTSVASRTFSTKFSTSEPVIQGAVVGAYTTIVSAIGDKAATIAPCTSAIQTVRLSSISLIAVSQRRVSGALASPCRSILMILPSSSFIPAFPKLLTRMTNISS